MDSYWPRVSHTVSVFWRVEMQELLVFNCVLCYFLLKVWWNASCLVNTTSAFKSPMDMEILKGFIWDQSQLTGRTRSRFRRQWEHPPSTLQRAIVERCQPFLELAKIAWLAKRAFLCDEHFLGPIGVFRSVNTAMPGISKMWGFPMLFSIHTLLALRNQFCHYQNSCLHCTHSPSLSHGSFLNTMCN